MPQVRLEGNELFKEGKFPEAIAKYSDAMKRNPKDHKMYSNRSACYQKLMEWQLALKDADTCVSMDPTFVKGWTRKASIHYFLKEYHKAMDAYNAVLKIEPENEEAKGGLEMVISKVSAISSTTSSTTIIITIIIHYQGRVRDGPRQGASACYDCYHLITDRSEREQSSVSLTVSS